MDDPLKGVIVLGSADIRKSASTTILKDRKVKLGVNDHLKDMMWMF